MIVDGKSKIKKTIPRFTAFVPFGIILIHRDKPIMSLKWVLLVLFLEAVAITTIYTNIQANDPVWAIFGVWAFIIVCRPIYFLLNRAKRTSQNQKNNDKLTFGNLFKICAEANFANYRIGLLSVIPLVVQALVGGSVIYTIYGGDWVMHALAGFGIGAAAFLAYRTSLDKYGYQRLHSYFKLDNIRLPKIERKTGALEFAIFGVIIVAFLWELMEYSVFIINPENTLRIHAETLFNRGMDFGVAIIGAIIAWYLIKYRLKWF